VESELPLSWPLWSAAAAVLFILALVLTWQGVLYFVR